MKLEDIVSKSAYCSIGCIKSPDDIDTLEQYLTYNKSVIDKFPKIIVAHTKTDNISPSEFSRYNNVWVDLFGDKCLVIERNNYGHTFGFIDLDSTVINKVKEFGYDWIWKSTNDILITESIFSYELNDERFLFFQGHGYTGIDTYYKCNVDLAVDSFKDNGYEYFFPQTNFFIISAEIDGLIDSITFNNLYNKCINDPDYARNKTQTEYKYVLCECVLRDCVVRNKLKSKHLLNKENYKLLLNTILMYRISDSSHKNIFFKECGICHFHFPNEQVIEI